MEDAVGDSEIAVEDQAPQQSDDRIGGGQRDDERHARQGPQSAQPGPVKEQGHTEPKRDLGRHHGAEERGGAAERLPEGRVRQDLLVIRQADEGKSVAHPRQIVLPERGDDREECRIDPDGEECHHGRRQEPQRRQPSVSRSGAGSWECGCFGQDTISGVTVGPEECFRSGGVARLGRDGVHEANPSRAGGDRDRRHCRFAVPARSPATGRRVEGSDFTPCHSSSFFLPS